MNSELLNKHLELVIKANETTNITRITSFEDAQILHIEDSLQGIDYIENAPEGRYGDMGSGAGFPGIPLAIESHRETVLIESIGKKATILESFISDLSLDNVSVYSGRLEELAKTQSETFAVLTARALSKLGSLMELASPLLKIGGRLICYKGSPDEEEIRHAKELGEKLGLYLIQEDEYYLSDGETHRSMYVFEKQHKAKIKLPRKNGDAQKKPL